MKITRNQLNRLILEAIEVPVIRSPTADPNSKGPELFAELASNLHNAMLQYTAYVVQPEYGGDTSSTWAKKSLAAMVDKFIEQHWEQNKEQAIKSMALRLKQ